MREYCFLFVLLLAAALDGPASGASFNPGRPDADEYRKPLPKQIRLFFSFLCLYLRKGRTFRAKRGRIFAELFMLIPETFMHIEELAARVAGGARPELAETWAATAREMRVHARGEDPADIILRRHLTEDEACFRWRLENYVPITRPAWQRAQSNLSRLLFGNRYHLELSDETRAYAERPVFGGVDFFLYLQQFALPAMLEDPNGLLAWVPAGEGLRDPAARVEPYPVLVPSEKIVVWEEGAAAWLSDEQSVVRKGGVPVREGKVFYALTDTAYVRLAQTGAAFPERYRAEFLYAHELGEVPAVQLGGLRRGEGCFESYFSGFAAFANEAIRQFSDWQVVTSTNAYPVKELRVGECDYPGCDHGTVNGEACPQCGGKGFMLRTGPFAALIRPEVNPALGETDDGQPMLRYITPPTEIIRYAQQAWESLLEQAERALNLRFVDAAQSGVAKAYDREELYAFLGQVSANVFDRLMFRSLDWIERYRELENAKRPVVHKPREFRLKSETELREEYAALSGARAPHLAAAALVELADRQFSGSPAARRLTRFLAAYDPLLGYSAEEIARLRDAGVVSARAAARHARAPQILRWLLETKGEAWFGRRTFKELADRVEAALDAEPA